MRAVQDLNDLIYFAAVVEHGGFAPAARALDVPKSNLSRRVARLEERLGVRLIERSTRRFSVTEIGQEFYRHCRAVAADAEAAEDAVAQVRGEPRGVVRLSAPLSIAQGPLAEVLPEFLKTHPKVRVLTTVTNRRVDLIDEGVDVALRVRQDLDTDSELMVRILARERAMLVASPGLLADLGTPKDLDELKRYPTLSHQEGPGRHVWSLTSETGETVRFEHQPRLAAGDFRMLVKAAIAGMGVTYLPLMAGAAAVRSGALTHILPEWGHSEGIFHLVFTSRRGQLPAVSALIDFLAARMPGAMASCPNAEGECVQS